MAPNLLLSTAYFPPISYFSKFIIPGYRVILEKDENYIKQSYRNRCIVYGPNGMIPLIVPVKRGSFHKTAIKELEIEYRKPWQTVHIKTIHSFYRAAPFFEFYIDDLEKVLSSKHQYLWDLNINILDVFLDLIGITKAYNISYSFSEIPKGSNTLDYREALSPKNKQGDSQFRIVEYKQVFSERFGFSPDLSILDLLFNTGPEAFDILERSVKK